MAVSGSSSSAAGEWEWEWKTGFSVAISTCAIELFGYIFDGRFVEDDEW